MQIYILAVLKPFDHLWMALNNRVENMNNNENNNSWRKTWTIT